MATERIDDPTVLVVDTDADTVADEVAHTSGSDPRSTDSPNATGDRNATADADTDTDANTNTDTDATHPPIDHLLESDYCLQYADTPEAALETLSTKDSSVSCVLVCSSSHAKSDSSPLEFVETVSDRFPEIPVVFVPENGDERLASDAVAAGVDGYVPRAEARERVSECVESVIRDAREYRNTRQQARGFDAIFDDPRTETWVLEPDGTLVRSNEAAREVIDSSAFGDGRSESGNHGRPFWECPWWTGDSTTEIQDAIERGARGIVDHRELTTTAGDSTRTLEVSVWPVTDETDSVVSLVVDATDVTERVHLEAELRASEELHRVTLNNMTDTVLITDESGAFTYVCPNVHFIFGYTDDQIHEMGTIDELLGEDLFNRDDLESEGVLTNIECTATDRAGYEHTLLVNVREVSIQDGTILYSCRDVTKRKQREEALTALQRTARQLLYAETSGEIGRIVVEDAPAVLGVEASAALVFDTDENVLRPVASSPTMDRLHGPFPTISVGDDSITGDSFVDGETRFFDDVHDSGRLENRATDLRSTAVVPLGDHGVFVAGSDDVGQFDEVTRELTDLLAATAEAALDRVERESTLREQDRELQQRNQQLTQLNRINEIIREIDQALVRAETREEIEQAVCEQLTAADRFRFAWIGEPDSAGETLTARTWSGHDRGYLDSVSFSLEREDGSEPASETAKTGSITVVSNVVDRLREAPWRGEALSREYQSVVSVPLAYDEFTYGVLTVYADRPSAFDDVSQAVFAELGETIASAMGAVERKNALLTASGTRLEVEIRDESFVFHHLAARANCTVSFSGGVRQSDDGTSVFATVDGAPVDEVAAIANELASVEHVQIITAEGTSSDGDGDTTARGGTLQLHLSQPFLALRLADHGIVLQRVEATPETARVTIDVPNSVDIRRSVEIIENAFTDVTLVSKETIDQRPVRDLQSALLERLTDRQLEVVQVAYYGGFFESPREHTGEEVADTLGISPAAFYRHNRTVQRKLLAALFDDIGLPASAMSPDGFT